MEILKKIINKYMPFSLGTLMTMVIMTSTTSCEGCKTSSNEDGVPVLGFNKTSVEAPEYDVEVTVNPNSEKTVDLTTTYLEVQVGGVVGGNAEDSQVRYEAYDDNGNESAIFIKGGESKREQLKHFYKVDDKTILESGDAPLTKKFTFVPEIGKVTEMTASFQIVDGDGNSLNESEKCLVVWKAKAVAPKYELTLEGLGANDTVEAATNELTIKVKNIGGKIENAEDFQVIVTNTNAGDAEINAGSAVTFAQGDLNNNIIEKKVQVTHRTKDTNFTIKLQHKDKGAEVTVATKNIIVVKAQASVPGTYTLAVNPNKIEDGSTNVTITVARVGGVDLKQEDLDKLSLKIAKKGDATINEVGTDGKLAFGTHKLTISAADMKTATKDLVIVPGADKKTDFTLTLLDEAGNPITGAEQTVEWGIDARLVLSKFAYNTTDRKITGTIRNIGKIDFPGGDLTWNTQNDEIKIGADKTGKIAVPAIAKGTDHNIDLGPFDITPGEHSEVKLKLTWDKLEQGFVEENNVKISEDANMVTVLEEVGIVTAKLGELDLALTATPINLASATTALKEAHVALEGAKAAEGKIGSSPLKAKAGQAVKAAEVEYTAKEGGFKAKATALVTEHKIEIEKVITADKQTNTIATAIDIIGAQAELGKVAAAVDKAREVANAVAAANATWKPDLSEVSALEVAAEDAFRAKAVDLVAEHKAEIEKVITADKQTNTIATAVDIIGAEAELTKVTDGFKKAMQVADAVVKTNPTWKLDLSEIDVLKIAAEDAFKAKAVDLVAEHKAEIEKVITADKQTNTIATAIDIIGAEAELAKVAAAVDKAREVANAVVAVNATWKPDLSEVDALEVAAEDAFKAKAVDLVAEHKAEIEKVITADDQTNTIATAVDIVGAEAELTKVTDGFKKAVQVADVVVKTNPTWKLDLTEVNELEDKAKQAFTTFCEAEVVKIADAVKAAKGEVDKDRKNKLKAQEALQRAIGLRDLYDANVTNFVSPNAIKATINEAIQAAIDAVGAYNKDKKQKRKIDETVLPKIIN